MLGHRQAFAWIDDWHSMTLEDVRIYESTMNDKTNSLVQQPNLNAQENATDTIEDKEETEEDSLKKSPTLSPKTPKSPEKKSMFNWF